MTRKIIATVLAAALSVTSINVGTAQAGDRDVAKLIVGVTALAIIGSALAAEGRKSQPAETHYKPKYQPKPQYKQRHQDTWNNRQHGWDGQKKRKVQTRHRPSVSRNCLMSVRSQRGWTEGYALRCAQNSTRAVLPSDCVRRNFAQGPRLFYSPVCLRRNGFEA